MNQLVASMVGREYRSRTSTKKRCLNLRFQGLFDTVSHLGALEEDDDEFDFGIPSAVRHVVHAVALNEYRGGAASFNLRSILGPQERSSGNRVEQAFVGAHSDIGGGYATGDLSDVALMWMLDQAKRQGIKFRERVIADSGWHVVTLPLLHDSSDNGKIMPTAAPHSDNRTIIYTDGTELEVKGATVVAGRTIAESKDYISYYRVRCGPASSPVVGFVDMARYAEWIKSSGTNIGFSQPANQHICQ